jgi:hypothetical protein
MANATEFILTEGYDMITNTSNMHIVGGVVQSWKESAIGLGAVLVFFGVIYLGAGIVYVRTQSAPATVLIGILLSWVCEYYGLFDISIYGWDAPRILMWVMVLFIVLLGIASKKLWGGTD